MPFSNPFARTSTAGLSDTVLFSGGGSELDDPTLQPVIPSASMAMPAFGSPQIMPGPPVPRPPTMGLQPRAGVQPGGPSFMGATLPILAAVLAGGRNPAAIGSGLAAFMQGKRIREADKMTREELARKREAESAEFYSRAIAQAQAIDDPITFEQWKAAITPVAQVHGIDPSVFVFNNRALALRTKKEAAELIEKLDKQHPDGNYTAEWKGQRVTRAELAQIAGQAAFDPASGKPVAPTTKPRALQPKDVVVNGQTITANYDPDNGKFYDQADKEIPNARLASGEPKDLRQQANEAQKRGDTAEYQRLLRLMRETGDAGRAQTIVINPAEQAKDPRVLQAAQLIADRRLAPSQLATFFTGMGKQAVSQLRPAVMSAVLAIDPEFDFAAAEAGYQFGKAPGTQTTLRYLDNISKTIPMMRRANQEFKRTGVRFINDVLRSGKSQFGSVDVADFDFKSTLIADEIAKVLQGGGTGSGTSDAKLKQAQELLAGDLTPEQFDKVLDAAEEMLTVRRDSFVKGTFMEPRAPKTPAPRTKADESRDRVLPPSMRATPTKVGRYEIVNVQPAQP